MGNSQNKTNQNRNLKSLNANREGQTNTSQFSISHFVGNLSGRSFLSATSNQSVYSTSRPWSRVSRRRWHDTTLTNPLDASKTAWPVAHKESIFLPEFPISTDLIQRDFDVKEVIAKGAFGEVCRVTKTSENKDFALKILSKSQVVSENAVRQVKDEARIQELCGHHSFIVGSVAKWQTKKRLYIVSEYIPGGELLALLDKYGRLPEELVKIFIAQIAIALDFLHNAGVIYRDLKPENILLDPQYNVQLIDFGLSKWLSIGERTTTLCGTLKYMAPEVLSRDAYGHAVDWWSLGVIACRMLLGEYPTPAVTSSRPKVHSPSSSSVGAEGLPEEQVQLDDSIEAPKPPGTLPASSSTLTKGARALLLRLLDKDPRVRLRSLRQLQQTAFFMGYNFDHVKVKKITPRSVLEKHFPDGPPAAPAHCIPEQEQMFSNFEQNTLIS